MEKEKVVSMGSVVDASIWETLARHAGLLEHQYLPKIGHKGARNEERAGRIARANLLQANMKETLIIKDKLRMIAGMVEQFILKGDEK